MAKPNARCSIEMEPRTLKQGQLHQAREVAADVVQKLEPTEASLLLIDIVERLKPMNHIIERGELPLLPPLSSPLSSAAAGPPPPPFVGDYNEESGRCQCSYICIESPNQLQLLKEPLSAPF
ncbi:uncharacterized protein LOC111456424 [Cucurbita moschata]|uniref:Uncharacterized protein LOC111456424 n=1 Tax=Cucurbita moschata TaxID=3662 RepID=A0A6J1GPS6_CUCMO|nr:uncharacterized protein LOC111456424 [Cucurbita moschata]